MTFHLHLYFAVGYTNGVACALVCANCCALFEKTTCRHWHANRVD